MCHHAHQVVTNFGAGQRAYSGFILFYFLIFFKAAVAVAGNYDDKSRA